MIAVQYVVEGAVELSFYRIGRGRESGKERLVLTENRTAENKMREQSSGQRQALGHQFPRSTQTTLKH